MWKINLNNILRRIKFLNVTMTKLHTRFSFNINCIKYVDLSIAKIDLIKRLYSYGILYLSRILEEKINNNCSQVLKCKYNNPQSRRKLGTLQLSPLGKIV